jgi:arabinan endo-1,5-alpha-L-arabinosidase
MGLAAVVMLLFAATSGALAQSIPSHIYLNRYSKAHTTDVFKGDSVARLSIGKAKLAKYDTLKVCMKNGEVTRYFANEVDSVTFYKPDNLYVQELAYYSNISNGLIPTYVDDYSTVSGFTASTNYKNWNLANIHDPSVMKAADGYYYMYQTDASYGNAAASLGGHFFCRRSKDMVTWTGMGMTMKTIPAWVTDSVNAIRGRMGLPLLGSTADNQPNIDIFWAPCARKVNDNLYRMYYVIGLDNYLKTGNATSSTFDNSWTERCFIGLMETTDPSKNVWTDKGYVICSSSDKGPSAWYRASTNNWSAYFKWNAIDPSYIITPSGEHWLVYGSWHSGECAIRLNPQSGKVLNNIGEPWNIGTGTTTTYGQRVNTRNASSRWQASEAPEVIYNPETGYYYMFLAYDDLSVGYNTRVCRSKNVYGPYYGMDGTNVSAGGECYPVVTHPYKFNSSKAVDGWVGFSHCAVWNDGQGNYYYCSQARLPENYDGNAYSNAIMMGHVRSIRWTTAGWPVVMPERYAAVPQAAITADSLVGNWENIDMSYSAGKQKTSSSLKLSSDGKMSGALNGTWSYDAEGQLLTLTVSGVKIELCVQRELDWEASPRVPTIVYAGYRPTGRITYWGKKSQGS